MFARRALRAFRPRAVLKPQPQPTRPRQASTAPPKTRAEKILARLPPSLQKHTANLRKAPVSHVVAFLILHEITAVVPLLALFGLFHYTEFAAPTGYVTERWGEYVRDGVGRFERYFTRKGWFGFGAEGDNSASDGADGRDGQAPNTKELIAGWEGGGGKYKLLADVALAWAIIKALLPLRIMASVWATPWFARVMIRARGMLSRKP